MLASEAKPIDARPGWEPTWLNNSGFKLPLLVSGSEHMSFDDLECVCTIKLAAAIYSFLSFAVPRIACRP
jgi:hypothetical protein